MGFKSGEQGGGKMTTIPAALNKSMMELGLTLFFGLGSLALTLGNKHSSVVVGPVAVLQSQQHASRHV